MPVQQTITHKHEKLTFGKHKGESLSSVDITYLQWLIDNDVIDFFDNNVKDAVIKFFTLDYYINNDEHNSDVIEWLNSFAS